MIASAAEFEGKYRLLERIGAGATATVWRAEQLLPRRQVALKIYRSEPGSNARSSFELEIAALARLNHPGIAHAYESGTYDDGTTRQPYLALELIRGRPIVQAVRMAAMSLTETIDVFLRVCEAVSYAHRQGVVHGDLKPSNVLVTPAAEPKLIDFGVCRTQGGAGAATPDTTSRLLGTYAYMSPEQIEGRGSDRRTDVYALGVLLFELLAGHHPWYASAQSLPALLNAIRNSAPPRLRQYVAGAPRDLECIVDRAMSPVRWLRYRAVDDLAEDLRRFRRGELTSVRRRSLLDSGIRATRRRMGLGVAVVGIIAALTTSGAVATVARHRALAATTERREQIRSREELTCAVIESFQDTLPLTPALRERLGQGKTLTDSVGARAFAHWLVGVAFDFEKFGPNDLARARGICEAAIELLSSLLTEAPRGSDREVDVWIAYSHFSVLLGDLSKESGDLTLDASVLSSSSLYTQAFEIDRMLARTYPDDSRLAIRLAYSHERLADIYRLIGDEVASRWHRDERERIAEREYRRSRDPRSLRNWLQALTQRTYPHEQAERLALEEQLIPLALELVRIAPTAANERYLRSLRLRVARLALEAGDAAAARAQSEAIRSSRFRLHREEVVHWPWIDAELAAAAGDLRGAIELMETVRCHASEWLRASPGSRDARDAEQDSAEKLAEWRARLEPGAH
ncbi:MAG: protein kinase [Planctomycetota bacterium]